jgi:hypothetical protein
MESNALIWKLDRIDATNTNGTMEFSVNSDDITALFPIHIEFSTEQSFKDIRVFLFDLGC